MSYHDTGRVDEPGGVGKTVIGGDPPLVIGDPTAVALVIWSFNAGVALLAMAWLLS